jgi:hypothetical protein
MPNIDTAMVLLSIHVTSRCHTFGFSYVTTNGNNIYYTNDIMNKVTCCDMNGKVQWEFHDKNVKVSKMKDKTLKPILNNSVMSV